MARKNDDDPPQSTSTVKRYAPIEPALILHWISAIMAFQVLQDLLLEKACKVNLNYSDTVCDALKTKVNLENYLAEEAEVQKLTSSVLKLRMIIENIFPIFLVLLLGAWSDKYGRKMPMIIVTLGFLIQNIGLVLCCWFDGFSGVWSTGWVSSIFVSLAGNHASFGMAAFSYLSETTEKSKQTSRTGLFHASFMFAMIVGIALGGFFSGSTFDYKTIFMFAFLLEFGAFAYIWFYIGNGDRKNDKSTKEMFTDLLNISHLTDTFKSVFKPRDGFKRLKLLSLILSHSCILAPMMGELGIFYLFCSYKFKWNGSQFGVFLTYKTVLAFIGTFVSLGIFNNILKLSDALIGIISCLSFLVISFVFAFAQTGLVMYLAPIISLCSGALMIVPRGLISKTTDTVEMGKINSFIASLESIVPLISGPMYSSLYSATFETFPGTVFLLSASFMIPAIIVFSVLLMTDSEEKSRAKKE